MFGFGNESDAREGSTTGTGSIHSSIPRNVLNTILYKGNKEQAPHLCFGASRRGGKEYGSWEEDKDRADLNANDFVPMMSEMEPYLNEGKVPPLDLWKDKIVVTVPCSDIDAVVEFVFVPFIQEEEVKDDAENEEEGSDHADAEELDIIPEINEDEL
jgi:hypothetical protein